MTWARTGREEGILRRSIATLAQLGLPLAVADRARSVSFSRYLDDLQSATVRVTPAQGLVAQVQASVALASSFNRPFILYTESDKEDFFSHWLTAFLERAPDDDEDGVVLAARSASAFHTFPPTQRYVEDVVNRLCADVIGTPGDYCYGPFLMHRSMAADVAQLPPTLGWGWRPWIFRAARRNGRRLHHVTGDYVCPAEQRDEDEGERTHRLRQLSENVGGLVA